MKNSENPAKLVLNTKSATSKWKKSGQKMFEGARIQFITYQEDIHSVVAIVSVISRRRWGVASPSSAPI